MDTTLKVRPAAVAGLFYPGEAGELRRTIQGMVAEAADLLRALPQVTTTRGPTPRGRPAAPRR